MTFVNNFKDENYHGRCHVPVFSETNFKKKTLATRLLFDYSNDCITTTLLDNIIGKGKVYLVIWFKFNCTCLNSYIKIPEFAWLKYVV